LKKEALCVIPGFSREVHKNCALQRYCAASSGNFLPTFRNKMEALSRTVWRTCLGRGYESVV